MSYGEHFTADEPLPEIKSADAISTGVIAVWTFSDGVTMAEGAVITIDGIDYMYTASPDEAYEVDASDPYQSLVDEINGDGNADPHPTCTAELTDTDEVTITATVAKEFFISSEDEDISDGLTEQVEGENGTPGSTGDLLLVGDVLYVKTSTGWIPAGGEGGGGGLTNGEPIDHSTNVDFEEPQVRITSTNAGTEGGPQFDVLVEGDEAHLNITATDGANGGGHIDIEASNVNIYAFGGESQRAAISAGLTEDAASDNSNQYGLVQALSGSATLVGNVDSNKQASVLVVGSPTVQIEAHDLSVPWTNNLLIDTDGAVLQAQRVSAGRYAKVDLGIAALDVDAKLTAWADAGGVATAETEAWADGIGGVANLELTAYGESGAMSNFNLKSDTGTPSGRRAQVSGSAISGGPTFIEFEVEHGPDTVQATFNRRGINLPYAGTVSSQATIEPAGNVFHVSGTVQIDNIALTDAFPGALVVMIFDDVLTVKDGVGNLRLAGDFVTAADSTLSLVFDGTNWFETSRSAN